MFHFYDCLFFLFSSSLSYSLKRISDIKSQSGIFPIMERLLAFTVIILSLSQEIGGKYFVIFNFYLQRFIQSMIPEFHLQPFINGRIFYMILIPSINSSGSQFVYLWQRYWHCSYC